MRQVLRAAMILAAMAAGCGGATPPPPAEAEVSHVGHGGPRASEALRQEHRHLLQRIEATEVAAAAIPASAPAEAPAQVEAVLGFFLHDLRPHASAEESVLYAVADRRVPTPAPYRWTDSLRHEHTVVHAAIEELQRLAGEQTPASLAAFSRLALATLGLVKGHFSAEENVVLAALDRMMTPAEFEREVVRPTEALVHHGDAPHGGEHHAE